MKTLNIFLFFTILTLSFSATAQVNFGIKGGVNISNTALQIEEIKDVIGRSKHMTLCLSLPVEFEVNKNFSIQPELTYLVEGTGVNSREVAGFKYATNIVNYVKLPVLAKFGLNLNNYKIYGMLGPSISYGLAMKAYYTDLEDNFRSTRIDYDFEAEGIKRLDFGISYGGGVETMLAKKFKMVIDLRCNLGLNDIDKAVSLETYTESLTLAIGLMIPMPALFSKKER